MLNGLSGLGLNNLVAAMARVRHGNPPSRNVQPMPRMDTVQISVRGHELAAGGGTAVADGPRPVGALRPLPAQPPTQPAEMSMMERLQASFFTKQGDAGFDSTADLNADGRINHADLAVLRAQESSPDPKQMLQQMQGAFFSRTGDDRFNQGLDLNTDGIINMADLAMLRARMENATVTRPHPEPQPTQPVPAVAAPAVAVDPASGTPRFDGQPDNAISVDAIRSAFFSQAGDDGYNAAADLNGDGRVNFADLAQLRAG